VLGQEHPDTLISTNNLGLLYLYQSRYTLAEPLLTKALEVRRRILGEEHPDTLLSFNNVAMLHAYERKYQNAEEIYVKVLEIQRRVLGAHHPRRLDSINDLAALYIKTRNYTAAEALLHEVLNTYDRNGADTWVRYRCQSLLGASLAGQKRYVEAESLLLSGYRGMVLRKTTIPWERRPALNEGAEWIARLYESWGKAESAIEWREKAQIKPVDHIQR